MSRKSRNTSDRKAGFAYFIREGLSSVFVHGFTSLAAVSVIAACLMITGIFTLVAYTIDLQIRELEGHSEIVVYIDASVSREAALAQGELSEARWLSYQKLKTESRYMDDTEGYLAEKNAKFKNIAKINRTSRRK